MWSRQGVRNFTEYQSVEIEWCPEGLPKRETGHKLSLQHDFIAKQLRMHLGVWARLPGIPAGYASNINNGGIAAYRPGGDYEAAVRNGYLYARYVGPE